MTARSVIEHALTTYYADSQQADQVVRVLLHNYDHDHRTAVLAEFANPADAATIYATRPCGCEETEHPTWCPASVPSDDRITEIRDGVGGPLTPRELSWLKGAADRHKLHVIGARGGHWPLDDDLPGALLLISQYLAAAVAVIERTGLALDEADAVPANRQAYDGELTMLRALVRALRVAARHGDLPAMQQALIHHASDDAEAREKSSRPTADATPDTLPAWLYQRFAVIHGAPPWDRTTDSDRSYWEHQARAVRRAVARGGFKTEAGEPK